MVLVEGGNSQEVIVDRHSDGRVIDDVENDLLVLRVADQGRHLLHNRTLDGLVSVICNGLNGFWFQEAAHKTGVVSKRKQTR